VRSHQVGLHPCPLHGRHPRRRERLAHQHIQLADLAYSRLASGSAPGQTAFLGIWKLRLEPGTRLATATFGVRVEAGVALRLERSMDALAEVLLERLLVVGQQRGLQGVVVGVVDVQDGGVDGIDRGARDQAEHHQRLASG
jgi:hypothetical protein